MDLIENLKEGLEIGVKKIFQVIWHGFGDEDSISLHSPPVGNSTDQPASHPCEASPQILLLGV